MAINVDNVYKTVLLILNKEQRGYITPDEFNKTATQVQLDIFEKYFDDINQQLRVPQSDYDYADRQMSIDEKLSIFKTEGDCQYVSGGKFTLPSTDVDGNTVIYNYTQQGQPTGSQVAFHSLGAVVYSPIVGFPTELQRLQRFDFYNIQKSPLTASTKEFPTYLYENKKLTVKPDSINSDISVSFLRKPRDVKWAYTEGGLGQFIWDPSNSQNFELLESEQVEVISKILFYSGVIIRDPQVIQVAASDIQKKEINEKS